ncbi:MAG: ABC transporter permease [Chloroflexi bacterium]|nr:MAG: ABC transporter permease [Chloroflexota bacterium]
MPLLPASPGPYTRAWRRLRSDRTAMLMLAYLCALIAAVLLLPIAIAIDPFQQSLRDSLLAPGAPGHPLGTDQFGVSGGLIGLLAGIRGGWMDRVLMRLIDVELAFPGILLALIIVTILGPGLEKVAIAVGIGGIPRFARIVRGSVLATRHELFVEAARSIGASELRIAFAHIVPQVLGPVITIATFGLATAIFSIAALSFLGLGAQPPAAEWGLMLSEARRYLRIAWWLAVFPGIIVTSVVLAANLLGDAVRDALDPRLFSKAD